MIGFVSSDWWCWWQSTVCWHWEVKRKQVLRGSTWDLAGLPTKSIWLWHTTHWELSLDSIVSFFFFTEVAFRGFCIWTLHIFCCIYDSTHYCHIKSEKRVKTIKVPDDSLALNTTYQQSSHRISHNKMERIRLTTRKNVHVQIWNFVSE